MRPESVASPAQGRSRWGGHGEAVPGRPRRSSEAHTVYSEEAGAHPQPQPAGRTVGRSGSQEGSRPQREGGSGGLFGVLDGPVNRGSKHSFAVLGALLCVVFQPKRRPAGRAGEAAAAVRASEGRVGAAPSL